MGSPFLDVPPDQWVGQNSVAFAVRDAYPVSPGHTLVVPRRLVPTWAGLTRDERIAVMDLVDQVRRALQASHAPDGFNLGVNEGTAAGQTVMHLHVHVIPRYAGDVPDPRGGVRHAVMGQGYYTLRPEGSGGEGAGGR